MAAVKRRQFLQIAGAGSGMGTAFPSATFAGPFTRWAEPEAEDRTVRLSGDGVGLTPPQYSRLLTRLLDEKAMTPDSYSLGGVVEELETEFARLLGKRGSTIVSPENFMLFTPLLPEAASGTLEPRHAVVPLRVMCRHAELILGRATTIVFRGPVNAAALMRNSSLVPQPSTMWSGVT